MLLIAGIATGVNIAKIAQERSVQGVVMEVVKLPVYD